VGHSTRSAEAFLEVVSAFDVELVVDVRRFAGSRRLPQFTASALGAALADAGVSYHEIPSLGGRRRADPASPNPGWRHEGFRGYADHMASEEFADGLFDLMMLASAVRTVIMCAEALWWRCHRRLIADVLTVLGTSVVHIFDERHSDVHRLAPPALVARGRLTYPP
jgi:uncharacterized protein (DUF488 family)